MWTERFPARSPDFVNRYLYLVVQLPGMSQVHLYYSRGYHTSLIMSMSIYTYCDSGSTFVLAPHGTTKIVKCQCAT